MVVRTGPVEWGDWASMISNTVFVAPLVISVLAARPVRVLLFLAVPVFSTFYHLCDSNINICLMSYDTLYGLDNFFAIMAAVSVVLSLATLPGIVWDILLQLVAGIPIYFMIEFNYRPFWLYVVLVASFAIAVFSSWLALYLRDGTMRFKKFHWPMLLVGALLMGVGVVLFAVVYAYPDKYPHNDKMLMHAGWHIGVGTGSALVLYAAIIHPEREWGTSGYAWDYGYV